MKEQQIVRTSSLISQVAELRNRERSLTYLLSRPCSGNHADARQELAATRMLRQAAEENLETFGVAECDHADLHAR